MLLEEITEHVTPKGAAAFVVGGYVLHTVAKWISDERRIRQLGGHTRRIPTYLPFGTHHFF
jgi:hypothetical protein